MHVHDHTTPAPADRPRPACPFCGAYWSDAMLDEYERLSAPCPCCGPAGSSAPVPVQPLPVPDRDLCCATCGRAILMMPGVG